MWFYKILKGEIEIMPKKSAVLKAQAKEQLNGRWGEAIVATLVVMAISIAVSILLNTVLKKVPIFSLFSVLISAPLAVGLISFMLKFINHQEVEISEVFSGFNRLVDSVLLSLLMGLFIFLWMLPFLIVSGILIGVIFSTVGMNTILLGVTLPVVMSILTSPIFMVLVVVYIAMIVVITIKSFSYGMSYYILVENPDMRATEALSWSKRITNGHKGRMFYISLSFIGWSILAAIPALLGYIWLMPYISVTMANLYVDLKELNPEYNAIVSGTSTDTPTDENIYN